MTFELETSTSEEMASGGGTYLETPGKYHFTVNEVLEDVSSKGKAIDGFTLKLEVLAGTVQGQEGKLLDLTFFKPSTDASKEKANFWARKKNTAFAIATNLIDPNNLGKSVDIDLQKAVGQQVVAELVPQEDADGNKSDKFLQLHFANLYHVDDPEAAQVPKSQEALSILTQEQRKPESYFAFKAKKDSKAVQSQPSKPVTRVLADEEFDDI